MGPHRTVHFGSPSGTVWEQSCLLSTLQFLPWRCLLGEKGILFSLRQILHSVWHFHLPSLWGTWSHSVYTQVSLIINLTHAKLSASGILSLFFVSCLTASYRRRLGTFLEMCYKLLKLTKPPFPSLVCVCVSVCVSVCVCVVFPQSLGSNIHWMPSILMVLFFCHWMTWVFFFYDYYFGK